VAWVPTSAELGSLADEWPCLAEQQSGFAARNSCRTESQHTLDLHARIDLGMIGGMSAAVVLDGFGLLEPKRGVTDRALLLVDPAADLVTTGGTVTVPVTVNPDFGRVLYPTSRGRMFRLGVRISG
jgi:hypothetical protein